MPSVDWIGFLYTIIVALLGGAFALGGFKVMVNGSIAAHERALEVNKEDHKDIENKFEHRVSELNQKIRDVEKQQRDEVQGLRTDINGMGTRFSDAIERSEGRTAARIEAVANSVNAQFEVMSRLLTEFVKMKNGNGG